MVTCSGCNRLNAIKCYCYFSSRQYHFRYVSGSLFSVEAFVIYAVNNNLLWKTKLYCPFKVYDEFMSYWYLLKPVLKIYYEEMK